jgi:hypothetical protein
MFIQPSPRWFRDCRWCLAILLVASALLRGAAAADTAEAAAAAELRLKNSADYLASDGLEGRGVGTKGLDLAAEFIASDFAKAGLKTDLVDGAPFQRFSLVTAVNMGDKAKNRLVLIGPPEKDGTAPRRIELELGKSFNPLAVGGSGQVTAPLVFVGYGITAKDLQKEDDKSPSTEQPAKNPKTDRLRRVRRHRRQGKDRGGDPQGAAAGIEGQPVQRRQPVPPCGLLDEDLQCLRTRRGGSDHGQ